MSTQQETVEGFRLSPQQERLFSLQGAGGGAAYRVRCVVSVEGSLERDALRAAVEAVVLRHEILRTTFRRLPGVSLPVQVIAEDAAFHFAEVDLSGVTTADQPARLDELFREEGGEPFDFERGPLLRVLCVTLSPTAHALLLGLPAVCADMAGLNNLVREIGRCYAACLSGEELGDEPLQYADLAQWQNDLLESEETAGARGFWRKHDSAAAALRLPFERRPRASREFRPESFRVEIAPVVAALVRSVAAGHGVALPSLFLSCWQALLGRLAGQQQVVVSTLFDGRKYEELRDTPGLIAKYLPVGSQLDDELTFVQALKRVDESVAENHRRQEYFNWEPSETDNPAGGPWLLPYHFDFATHAGEFSAAQATFRVSRQTSCLDRFRLKLSCADDGSAFSAEFHFDADLYRRADVECLAEQFVTLLESAVRRPSSALADLEISSPAHLQKLLAEFNATREEYPPVCLHEPFERQAALTPDRVAVSCGPLQLTYSELDSRADSLASGLRLRGVGPDVVVGLLAERSAELVVGLLAILKAGGAYLPLEPSLPEGRLRLMCEGAGARLAVVATDDDARLAASLGIDAVPAHSSAPSTSAPEGWRPARPSNLAYVIYTSGSTGTPKGVMVAHSSICNRLEWMRRRFPPA
ncbi:MAG TPA: condensation domain-containing protein, partial [Pyrinomonadaceae bacterium]|nr:condensation domain-containing protein [Pyrinomonadaceae bacterium]